MKSFFRWQPAPVIDGLDDPILPAECPVVNKYEYKMPIAAGDVVAFIADAADLEYDPNKAYRLALVDSCKVAVLELGAAYANELNSQLYITATIPFGLKKGECYRFVWYEIAENATAWTPTGVVSCELDSNGNQTGFQLVEQSRTLNAAIRTPIVISNPMLYLPDHRIRKTKTVFYNGSGYDFGHDFKSIDFTLKVRLEITIAEANYEVSTKEYRQTNGVFRRGNTFIDKKYILNTEYFDEATHDAFVNALHHDIIEIEGRRFFASGEYSARHQETALVPDRFHPMWSASIEIKEQGYNQRNNACDLEPTEFGIYDDQYADQYA